MSGGSRGTRQVLNAGRAIRSRWNWKPNSTLPWTTCRARSFTRIKLSTSSFVTSASKRCIAAPRELLEPGQPYPNFLRYLAEHGYYGEGDVEALVAKRVESLRNPSGKTFEDMTPDGRIYRIRRQRVAAGGTVTVMTDVTEQKQAERDLVEKEAQLHLALDNMPGALVYTDANLNIVTRNDRITEMYPAPKELLEPGRPYAGFLRYLAENGYYGDGDIEALVAKRLESVRNPSGKTFEDLKPDGRVYRIRRSGVSGGGTVTVMTDITEQKQAERELLEAKRRAEEANKLVTEKNETLEALVFQVGEISLAADLQLDLQW